MSFTVSRQIAIDAGHRVQTHGSKCRNLHGHRYVIEAVCIAESLAASGEQSDMVVDFGFLKEEMLAEIDAACDHGFLAYIEDHGLLGMFCPETRQLQDWILELRSGISRQGYVETDQTRMGTKLYVLDVSPTAEQLSRHWFHRLEPRVQFRTAGLARLQEMIVWETPNCRASFRP